MQEKNDKAIVLVKQVSINCPICGNEGHLSQDCTLFATSDNQLVEVNYTQNQGPFSQSYNPAWRNHPNLSYKNANQQNYPQGNQQNYQQATQPQYAQTALQNLKPLGNMQYQHTQQQQSQQSQANQQNASSSNSKSEIMR